MADLLEVGPALLKFLKGHVLVLIGVTEDHEDVELLLVVALRAEVLVDLLHRQLQILKCPGAACKSVTAVALVHELHYRR